MLLKQDSDAFLGFNRDVLLYSFSEKASHRSSKEHSLRKISENMHRDNFFLIKLQAACKHPGTLL